MEKIEVFEETKYCWDCPKCGDYNVSDADRIVCCEHCGEEFKVGKVSS